MTLQMVTYNIGGARKLRQPPHDPEQVGLDAAATLRRSIDPDLPTIIALQETGEIIRAGAEKRSYSAAHRALQSAFDRERYWVETAPEVSAPQHPHARLWNRPAYTEPADMAFVSGYEGNAILGNLMGAPWPWPTFDGYAPHTVPVVQTQISRASLYSTGNRDTQPRNVMAASVEHEVYGHLFVLNTHLGTLSGEDRHDPGHPRTVEGNAMRLHQAEGLARVTAELRAAEAAAAVPQRPILLTGDFNAIPGSEPMDTLIASGYRLLSVENTPDEAYTHNVHKLLIDHVLVHDPAGVLPAGHAFVGTDLPFDDLTDHRPVIAIFD